MMHCYHADWGWPGLFIMVAATGALIRMTFPDEDERPWYREFHRDNPVCSCGSGLQADMLCRPDRQVVRLVCAACDER
jgi:hypothetical protein